MYQEEMYSNAITDAKKQEFGSLNREVKGMEKVLERIFEKIFNSTAAMAERDFNVQTF